MTTPSVYEEFLDALRFCKHLPDYYRLHRLNRFKHRTNAGVLGLRVWEGVVIQCPNNAITYDTWQRFLMVPSGRAEIEVFMDLRKEAISFLDIGAAEGIFSAVFSTTARLPSTITAVEPVHGLCAVHEKTRRANLGVNAWSIHSVAIGERNGETRLGSKQDFGDLFEGSKHIADMDQAIEIVTLKEFTKRNAIAPDLLKIDVESYEYEILLSSIGYLKARRPKIHLELHCDLMRRRGKDPAQLMDALKPLYRVHKPYPANYLKVPIARMGLVPIDGT